MGLWVISNALTAVCSAQGLVHGMSKKLMNWGQGCSVSNFSSSSSSSSVRVQCVGAPRNLKLTFSTGVVVSPLTCNRVKTLPRTSIKKRRRTKRKIVCGDDGFLHDCDGYGYEEVYDFFVGGGDARGPFDNNLGGGGSGSGSGKGGNFGGFGGSDWGDFSSDNSYYDPAFDFVYEVLSWIILTNCLHFAYKNVLRIRAARYTDPASVKVSVSLATVC